MHDRDLLPIGKWEDIKITGSQLIASPNFDDDDEFAVKIQIKYDKGVLNAASIGLDILEMSSDKKLQMPGQTRETISKSLAFEASIVDLPSNRNCVKLNFPKRGITLSGNMPEDLLDNLIPKSIQPMKKLALKYGLPEDASEDQILAAIEKADQKLTLAAGNTEAGLKLLLTIAESKGFKKETIEKLAKSDFAAAVELVSEHKAPGAPEIEQKPDSLRLSDLVTEIKKLTGDKGESTVTKTFSEMVKTDREGLKKLFASKPADVQAMYKAEFGNECTIADLSKIL